MKHAGEPWTVGEVALCYLVKKSKESKGTLARLLGRTEDAIDFAWRWCDGARFPKEASNRIEDHVKAVIETLGENARGLIERLPSPVKPSIESTQSLLAGGK